MRFNIDRSTAPTFAPTTVTITTDTAADLALVTNLFGGVPAESSTPEIDTLAAALRAACDASGISKTVRKSTAGFNWGKRLRDCLADCEG